MNTIDSASTVRVIKHWFALYSLLSQLVSDNGPQSTSSRFELFMKQNGINHIHTSPYHQSSNGQAERYVQIIKKGLKNNTNDVSMAYYKHTASLCILEGSLSVIRRSFTSDNNYSQCCVYPAYISINIKTPFITNDHQIICA